MKITSKLTMELTRHCSSPIIHAVQDDKYSRALELTLLEDGNPWIIPQDATVLIRYRKSDGKGGAYTTLPDETPAWETSENVLTLTLAPQVLTTPGPVNLAVILMRGEVQISTFAIVLDVKGAVHALSGESENYFHVPGYLPAPDSAKAGQFLQVATVDADGHVTRLKAASFDQNNREITEPEEDDIPKVFFGGVLPQTKDDTIMSFRYVSQTEDIRGYCKTKAQGNSSMQYPKKNQTVKLYQDADCTQKLKVAFKGWGMQNKFCFKANWIDLTHARNIVSARLWGDVVKSRANYDSIPEPLRASPNHGAVDGFPVKVYANGVYQGRYTINIPKDAWMANMDEDQDNHCILCGENYVSGCFRAEAQINGSDWTDEVHKTVPAGIKTRWNEAINFIMNSTDNEFIAGIGNFFDVDSLIDYYIFGLVTCNNDGFGKNQLYMTYDGQKWYATVYDVDNTFGTYLGYILAHNFGRQNYEDFVNSSGNLLYVRLEELFPDAIRARYAQLKEGALSPDNIINRFERFTDIVPPHLVEEDYAQTTANGAFTAIPLQGKSHIQQIRDYLVNHYPYVDSYIDGAGTDPYLLYSLPAEAVFTGTAGQAIDTGVKLFDTAKDFTVICDITPGEETKVVLSAVWSCNDLTESSFAGAKLARYPYDPTGLAMYSIPNANSSRSSTNMPDTERLTIAVVFTAGIQTAVMYKLRSGSEIVTVGFMNTDRFAYTAHDNTMVLGALRGYTDTPDTDNWIGTIHALEVYSKSMTTAELEEKLMA